MRSHRTVALGFLFLSGLLVPGPLARARQDETDSAARDPRKAIAGFQRYLERKPYHDWAFDKLVEDAVAVNALGELVQGYAAQVAEDPGALAPRVVLARLYARTDRIDEALELLAGVQEQDAALHRLVGALQLRAGRWDEAVAALDRAVASTSDPQLLEEIHEERGKAHLAAGRRAEAAKAFRAVAELDPESFTLRLETASELAWNGLTEDALEEFATAEELAGDDTAKRCRVLSEIGRLHERLSEGAEAVETYRRAIALMARGHWLKRDLYERILAIHQRAGTMEALLADARAAAQDASDLDAREFLARALSATGDHTGAREVLAAAIVDFPSDLELSRSLLDVEETLGDDEGRIAEYQRILGERPDELELYLELGQVFASSGKFEQARRQWDKTLEKRLSDAGLCVRLAGYYALFDQVEDAISMYTKAIALEPGEVRHYSELAAFLAVQDRRDEVPPLLERAETASAGDSTRLADVASLWSEYGEPTRARAALEAALELSPEDARLQSRLAEVLIRAGELDRATVLLHRIVATAREGGLRSSAVDQILRLFRRQDRLDELLAMEEAAIAADPAAVAPRLVLGRLRVQRREPDLAIEVYTGLLALGEESEDARKALARLYEDRGEYDEALAQYQAIIAARPQARRSYLQEIARIHLARYDQERAFECYDEILRSAPDNAAAFKEVAEAYDRLGLHEKRLECLQQAVRLQPDDARAHLDLAEAWRTLGEFGRAREEITEATRLALDRDTREDARMKLYLLLGETGELDAEIASLRRRIDENPYDMEAPLMLTDIYVRELEYELALEMLDKLIAFQPKETQLLEERARLYRLTDRHAEAIADYEALWKLADTDRGELSLDLAEAAIESGDLDRAAKVLAGVADARKVAQIYRQHDLQEQAIEVLQKGVAGSPGDDRMLLSLASTQEEVGDLEGAAEALERLLYLRGDSWRVLTRLADLYHDLGRKDDSLAIGRRLFGMLRIEETVEEEEKPRKSGLAASRSVNSPYRYFNANQQYTERLSALQSLFREKGWMDEFVSIGLDEMSRQPTNSALYYRLVSDLRTLGEREEDMRTLARSLRAAFEATGRYPAEMTARDWRNRLLQDEMNVYGGQSVMSEARIAELGELIADGTATEDAWVELAQLHRTLQHDADVLDTLRRGVAAFPDSIQLRAGLATTLEGEKRYPEACEQYARLVEALAASDWNEREKERLDDAFDQQRRTLLQRFPLHVQPRVDDTLLRRAYDVTNGPTTYLSWGLGNEPSLDGARLEHAQCLLKLGRKDEAREVLRSLEPRNPEYLPRWIALAKVYYDEELFDEAEEVYGRIVEIEETLNADPVLGHLRSWDPLVTRAMPSYGRIEEKRGDVLGAYHLLRTYGHTQEGELLLTTHGAFDEAEERYRAERASAAEALAADPESDTVTWRDASIRLADVLQFEKRWDEVLSVYEELADRLDDDFSVQEQIAALHLRAGRVDDAIATRYRIIEKKRELNRHVERDLAPKGRVIAPTPPGGTGAQTTRTLGRVVYYAGVPMLSGAGGTARGPGGLYELKGDYERIVQLHLDRHEASEAADVLARLARDDATTFRWMRWEILQIVQNYQLGKDGLPIVRLLHSYAPDDDDTALEYGRCLIKAGRLDEAHKVLQRVVNRGDRRYYTNSQAREELERLEARMGLESEESTDDLAAAVEADPKNVKTRMNLARRLFRERRFEEALEAGLAAEELAPHQLEVAAFVKDALTVLDRREELEVRLRKELDEEKSAQRRFEIVVRLADWMAERGEPAEAIDELFDRVVEYRWGGTLQYAPSSWWFERGDLDRGRELLQREIERMGPDSNSSTQARYRLAELDLHEGKPERALEEIFERFEKATNRTARLSLFGELAGVIRSLSGGEEAHAEIERLSAQWGGERAVLLPAAAELAFGEMEAFERRLDALVQDGEEHLWFYPALVDVARQRGDLEAALAYLRRLESLGVASRSRTAGTSIGGVSELVALRAEIGSLLFELGREDEALAVWETLFEEEDRDDNRQVLASLYRLHELYDEALVPLRELLDEEDGATKVATLRQAADIERELGDLDEAIRLAERAEVLSGHGVAERLYLADLHRRRGTLPDYFRTLVEASTADPDDGELARVVVQLAIELGEDDLAIAAVERVVDKPDEAKVLKPYLLRMKLLRGDEDGALDVYEDLLQGNVDEWRRQQYGTQLARALAQRGELERAKAVLRRSYPDPEGYEAVLAIASQLAELELHEEALHDAEAAIDLDPRGTEAWILRVRMLVELGRTREALDACLQAIEDPDLVQRLDGFLAFVPGLAAELGEEERLAAACTADPGAPRPAFRLGLIRALQHRHAEAVGPLETALSLDPSLTAARWQLARTYQALERFDDAASMTEGTIEILDRERVLARESWNAESLIDGQIRQLQDVYLRAGDVEAAVRVPERMPGARYREASAYSYSYGNNPFRDSYWVLHWLQGHGLHREYVQHLGFYGIFDRWSRMNGQAQEYEERYLDGDVSALEDLWAAIVEPGRALVGAPSSGSSYYYSSQATPADPRELMLARLFREEGRFAELVGRVRAELEVWPEDPVMRPLLIRLLEDDDRWDEVAELREADLAEEPDDADRKRALARALVELGRDARAIPLLEDVYRSRVADVPEEGSSPYQMVRIGGAESRRGTSGKVRFAWSGSWTGSNLSRTYYSSGGELELAEDPVEAEVRYLLMVAYARAGRTDDARALERVARSMDVLRSWGRGAAAREIVARYADADLADDAERVALQALEDRPDDYGKTYFPSRMCALFERLGDETRRREWGARWLSALDESVERAPFAPGPRLDRARVAGLELHDREAALEDVEQVLAWVPTSARARTLRAWLDLETGDAEGALAGFAEAERLGWLEGRGPDADLLFGRGFALAALEGPGAARPVLLRALADQRKGRNARRAEELLQ